MRLRAPTHRRLKRGSPPTGLEGIPGSVGGGEKCRVRESAMSGLQRTGLIRPDASQVTQGKIAAGNRAPPPSKIGRELPSMPGFRSYIIPGIIEPDAWGEGYAVM